LKLLVSSLLSALLMVAAPAASGAVCPEPLADVIYGLYRWVSTLEAPPGPLYDAPPYDQVGITLWLAREPGDAAFWAGHYWLGMAWYETPYLVVNARYGEMLVVPGRYPGTGGFVDDRVFMPSHTRTWVEIGATQLDQESGEGWARQLRIHLPEGSYIAKGIRVDYATLRGETDVWRKDDANCCPSGGRLRFTLELTGPEPRLAVAAAIYTGPDSGAP
jgi:hypothetical protein